MRVSRAGRGSDGRCRSWLSGAAPRSRWTTRAWAGHGVWTRQSRRPSDLGPATGRSSGASWPSGGSAGARAATCRGSRSSTGCPLDRPRRADAGRLLPAAAERRHAVRPLRDDLGPAPVWSTTRMRACGHRGAHEDGTESRATPRAGASRYDQYRSGLRSGRISPAAVEGDSKSTVSHVAAPRTSRPRRTRLGDEPDANPCRDQLDPIHKTLVSGTKVPNLNRCSAVASIAFEVKSIPPTELTSEFSGSSDRDATGVNDPSTTTAS